MDNILGFFGIVAAGAAVEKSQNQITFENFIVQAQSATILTYKKGCLKGMFGQPLDKLPYGIKPFYNILYDCLVSIGVIEKNIDKWSIITASSAHTVTKDISKLKSEYIQKMLENENSFDYQQLKNCFDIDFNKLTILLTNYNYDVSDQIVLLKPGKKGGKKKKSRPTKKRMHSKK
jgi:hypothetical protein